MSSEIVFHLLFEQQISISSTVNLALVMYHKIFFLKLYKKKKWLLQEQLLQYCLIKWIGISCKKP